jgi:hypothetical protein
MIAPPRRLDIAAQPQDGVGSLRSLGRSRSAPGKSKQLIMSMINSASRRARYRVAVPWLLKAVLRP